MKIFLDNAGNAFTHPSVIKISNQIISKVNNYNNPHNTSSSNTSDSISEARKFILESCGFSIDTHVCLFTSGATGSCKLLAESIHKSITFTYLLDNHNSILGLANCFTNHCISSFDEIYQFTKNTQVFAYPVESNFNGKLYPLKVSKKGNLYTILDASKYLSTNPMKNLKETDADFILFSIYKITGLPQGLGVLLVRKRAINLLDKKYFGGGTVQSILPSTLDMVPRPFQEYYEDGTIPYINIIIAHKALQFIQPLIEQRKETITNFANYLFNKLKELGYVMYSQLDNGSIVTFNHPTIGHKTIESLLESHGIKCRTGCFCNPGACQQQLCLTDKDLLFFRKSGKKCWDNTDTITIESPDEPGKTITKHTGAVRLSIGLSTTIQEIDRCIKVLNFPTVGSTGPTGPNSCGTGPNPKLVKMFVYPIKSCNGIEISTSVITANGLHRDRIYAIVNQRGETLTAKKFPSMTKLKVIFNDSKLAIMDRVTGKVININENFGQPLNKWLMDSLGIDCSLVYENNSKNFSNTSQYLLVNEQSMYDLNYRVISRFFKFGLLKPLAYLISRWYWYIDYDRFRPNLVINSTEYSEDSLEQFKINGYIFTKDMLCTRCNSTTINNNTFSRDKTFEPMTTLMDYRNNGGKVNFGVLYSCQYGDNYEYPVIKVGNELKPS